MEDLQKELLITNFFRLSYWFHTLMSCTPDNFYSLNEEEMQTFKGLNHQIDLLCQAVLDLNKKFDAVKSIGERSKQREN